MANEKCDPSLSQAGFMDLVCALQAQLKTTDALNLLAAMPNAQREAAMRLGDAATNYVNVVQTQ